MTESKSDFKKSAGVILVARVQPELQTSFDYKILTLKRPSESSIFPGATVFPGGVLEKADTSKEWLDVFKTFGFGSDSFDKIKAKENELPIYKQSDANELPPFISFRIAAIRETFEETGVLICRSCRELSLSTPWTRFVTHEDLVNWQRKVHENADEFKNLCKKLSVYPDVWSLHEWSNWMSPYVEKSKFCLVLFLVALQEVPPIYMDTQEADQLNWCTPEEYCNEYAQGNVLLLLPQFYEISRIRLFSRLDDLAQFAQERARYGTEAYTLVRVMSDDNFECILLPGDDLYPSDLIKTQVLQLSSVPETKVQHRMYFHLPYKMQLAIKNYKSTCNHVVPLNHKMYCVYL